MEFLRKAFAAPVVFSCQAVDRKYEDQVGIGQTVDIIIIVSRFSPEGFTAMITVLKNESAAVNGIIDHRSIAAAPASQFSWCSWNVAKTAWTKIIHNCSCIGCC